MWCPHYESTATRERRERTELGYRRFRCRTCEREFNERTGTCFNHLQYPTDVVCLVVLWRVRYKLSLREFVKLYGALLPATRTERLYCEEWNTTSSCGFLELAPQHCHSRNHRANLLVFRGLRWSIPGHEGT